jgi:hypothetical protein
MELNVEPTICSLRERQPLLHNMEHENLDLLWGAEAIGRALNIDARRAFYLLETKAIPAKKVGGRWVVSRLGLRKFFAEAVEPCGQ